MQVRLIIATNQNLNKHIFVSSFTQGSFGIWNEFIYFPGDIVVIYLTDVRRASFMKWNSALGPNILVLLQDASIFTQWTRATEVEMLYAKRIYWSFFFLSIDNSRTEPKDPFPHDRHYTQKKAVLNFDRIFIFRHRPKSTGDSLLKIA